MALTKVQIISNAISNLGHAPISSLNGGDSLVVAAEQAFDMLLPASLSNNQWRFAVQIQQLSKSATTPPTYWKSIYLLPADFLKTVRIYPQMYQWEIYKNSEIYAQYDGELWLEYVYQPDPTLLPSSFVLYFIYEIATYLSLSNAEKTDYFRAMDQKRKETWAIAASIDTQNRPQSSQANIPVIDNRSIDTLTGNVSSF